MSSGSSDTENNSKEMELETWPAFVDILSSTVVVLAFAFFILVVIQSISKITTTQSTTSTQSKSSESGGGNSSSVPESTTLSDESSAYPNYSIVSPTTLAQNRTPLSESSSNTKEKNPYVPQSQSQNSDATSSVTVSGQSKSEVLGKIPKFTEAKVMSVLKELVIAQQNVIEQQRKVIEQQDTKVAQTTREYQSLLSLVTDNPEIEQLRQKIIPKNDQAKFIEIDRSGELLSGTSNSPKGRSNYVLSPPSSPTRDINIEPSLSSSEIKIKFNDNAQYLNGANLNSMEKAIKDQIASYKSKGVVITATPSDYALSVAEGKRIAISRLLIIRSLLIKMGVDPSLIKFNISQKSDNQSGDDQQKSYGSANISLGG